MRLPAAILLLLGVAASTIWLENRLTQEESADAIPPETTATVQKPPAQAVPWASLEAQLQAQSQAQQTQLDTFFAAQNHLSRQILQQLEALNARSEPQNPPQAIDPAITFEVLSISHDRTVLALDYGASSGARQDQGLILHDNEGNEILLRLTRVEPSVSIAHCLVPDQIPAGILAGAQLTQPPSN